MSFFDEFHEFGTQLLEELGAPGIVIVRRGVAPPLSKADRAAGKKSVAPMITLPGIGAKKEEKVTALDGTVNTVTTIILNREVQAGDVIQLSGKSYTVTDWTTKNPDGKKAIVTFATIK